MSRPCVIQLGRFGDILNILPAVKYLRDTTGKQPVLVVAEAFKSIADAISYAEVVSLPLDFSHWRQACEKIRTLYPNFRSSQVYGQGVRLKIETESFCVESFKQLGREFLQKYREGAFDSILIDRRYKESEEMLLNALPKTGLPIVLVNTVGNSSPFARRENLFSDLRSSLEGIAEVVDLGKVRADRFTDLLGLYDHAALLVTTDTGTLHLAGAHTIPYVALITDQYSMWHGGLTRGNCILRFRYSRFEQWRKTLREVVYGFFKRPAPSFVHVYQEWLGSGDARRRHQLASITHKMNYAREGWTPFPVHEGSLPRLFPDRGRQLPYLKDLIDAAAKHAEDKRIVLTNTDTCFAPNLCERLGKSPLVVGRRRDFSRFYDPKSDDEIGHGTAYCGADCFVFPASWWKQRRAQFPDMVLAAEGWDAVLAQMLLRDGAVERTNDVYHERHPSHWEQVNNRYTLPCQKHNLALAKQSLSSMGFKPSMFGIK